MQESWQITTITTIHDDDHRYTIASNIFFVISVYLNPVSKIHIQLFQTIIIANMINHISMFPMSISETKQLRRIPEFDKSDITHIHIYIFRHSTQMYNPFEQLYIACFIVSFNPLTL